MSFDSFLYIHLSIPYSCWSAELWDVFHSCTCTQHYLYIVVPLRTFSGWTLFRFCSWQLYLKSLTAVQRSASWPPDPLMAPTLLYLLLSPPCVGYLKGRHVWWQRIPHKLLLPCLPCDRHRTQCLRSFFLFTLLMAIGLYSVYLVLMVQSCDFHSADGPLIVSDSQLQSWYSLHQRSVCFN